MLFIQGSSDDVLIRIEYDFDLYRKGGCWFDIENEPSIRYESIWLITRPLYLLNVSSYNGVLIYHPKLFFSSGKQLLNEKYLEEKQGGFQYGSLIEISGT